MIHGGSVILSASDATTATGSAIDVNQIIAASFTAVFADVSAAGALKLQVSNDLNNGVPRNLFVPTHWSDIPNATSTIASGVGPAIVIGQMCFSYIRAVYTPSGGGTTTVTVIMNALSA